MLCSRLRGKTAIHRAARRIDGSDVMPVDVHTPTLDLDRMDDDGGPPCNAFTRPRRLAPDGANERLSADASHLAIPADARHAWYRRLGASHRQHDELSRLNARVMQERDDARQLACHHRWPAIVDEIRTLIDCYNEGAGEEILTLVDGVSPRGSEPTTTVAARSGRTLVMAVEDGDLWVRGGYEDGRTQGERWIGLNRTDEATAELRTRPWGSRRISWTATH